MSTETRTIEALTNQDYKYGFVTDIEADTVPRGLNEDIIRQISAQQGRAGVAARVAAEGLPDVAHARGPRLGQRPLRPDRLPGHHLLLGAEAERRRSRSLDEVDPEIRRTFEKLGIPLDEQKALVRRGGRRGVRQRLGGHHVQGEARGARHHLLLVLRGGAASTPTSSASTSARSCRYSDNFFAALNSAVFSDGSFCYVPKGVRCPMELSTYFRINAQNTGQFERTLIIADEGAYVSYLEGCTAPMRDENQLHAAVVELVALDRATIKYSTVQNWYPGRQERQGRHLQLRDQARALPRRRTRRSPGRRSRPARPSRGSTRAASCRATTRSASSTRSR